MHREVARTASPRSGRPTKTAELLLTFTFITTVIGLLVPAYRLAFNADNWLHKIPYAAWGPIGLVALICSMLLPALQFWVGLRMLHANGSVLAQLIGSTLILTAFPTVGACLYIVGSVGIMMAG